MELKRKTVLITGGSAGIGLESVRQFLAQGASVIITGRDQGKLDEARQLYPAIVAIKSDVSDQDAVQSLYKQVEQLGGIDILYNNAGVGSAPLNLGSENSGHYQDAAYEMDINYLGVIRLTNSFIEQLKSRKESAIINTTSVLSYVPALLAPTYSASKAALRFYTESLRQHLKVLGSTVKVFELLPPLVETEMTSGLDAPKITPEKLVTALMRGLAKDQYTIRVGDTKVIYALHRLLPKLAFKMMNAEKLNGLLK